MDETQIKITVKLCQVVSENMTTILEVGKEQFINDYIYDKLENKGKYTLPKKFDKMVRQIMNIVVDHTFILFEKDLYDDDEDDNEIE